MLKSSHKKIKKHILKNDGKIDGQEKLKGNQYDQYIFNTVCMGTSF